MVRLRGRNLNGSIQQKDFGFAVPEDDPCDAFIHITTLQDAGITELGEGAIISCYFVKGPKGALITKVDKLIDVGENPAPITFRVDPAEEENFETMEGTVKWYKPDKGFGFIIPEDGQKDIFIHKSCLEKKRHRPSDSRTKNENDCPHGHKGP